LFNSSDDFRTAAAGDLNLVAADPMKQVTDPWRNHPNFSYSPDCVFRGGRFITKRDCFHKKRRTNSDACVKINSLKKINKNKVEDIYFRRS
jgi:hypothetical protein